MTELCHRHKRRIGHPLRYRGRMGRETGQKVDADKRLALDRLIANGFVEQANGHSVTNYKHTTKTELLLSQLCVGISGG